MEMFTYKETSLFFYFYYIYSTSDFCVNEFNWEGLR